MFHLLLFLVCVPLLTNGKCTFTVVDEVSVPKPPSDSSEFLGSPDACPFYTNNMVCCNDLQNIYMQRNFQAIDATFGSAGGGCDMCASNLKRFWCEYTCNPNQLSFVKEFGEGLVPDPLDADRKKKVSVQFITITIFPQTACDIWSSCKRTQFASQVSAMQSPGGFFNFQGENAVTQARQIISVEFSDDPEKSLYLPNLLSCNFNATNSTVVERLSENVTIYTEPYGMEVKQNCSCNNCDLSCTDDVLLYQPTGVLEGFDTILVLIVWGVVLTIVFLITIVRKVRSSKNKVSNPHVVQRAEQQNLLVANNE